MSACRYPAVRGIRKAAPALASLFFFPSCLMALNPGYAVSQYGHAAWTQAGGHLPGSVLALTQTNDGALWVGTEFGLFRFDGLTFVPWNPPIGEIPSQSVTALAPAADGGLWVGTRKGLFYRNQKVFQQVRASEGTEGAAASAILSDRTGTVWMALAGFGSGGLCRVDATRLQCLPVGGLVGETIFSLFEDRAGKVWAGGTRGLYVCDKSSVRQYAAFDASTGVSGIAQVLDGSMVWTDAGMGPQRLVNGRIMPYAGVRTESRARILLSDHEGSLWIGTMGQGLLHVHQGHIDKYSREDGLSGDTVYSLLEDREHNIWVATDRGLDRFRDLPVVTFSKREGLSDDTAGSVFSSRTGGVWIGTTKGLNLVQDGRVSVYDKQRGLVSNSIGSIFENHTGNLWVDSTFGLTFSRGPVFRRLDLPQGRRIRYVAAAVEDRQYSLWLSDLERGLICIRDGQVQHVVPWSSFKDKKAWSLDVDQRNGDLLLGFLKGEFAVFGPGHPIRWYTVADGLGRGDVTSIRSDPDGAIWIATEGGLSRLVDGRISTLTTKNGLPCDRIHAMIEDDDGATWLNTACGLVRLTRQDLVAWSADPRISVRPRVYGNGDGMHVRSATQGYGRRTAKSLDGRLWFPVFDGVAIVDPRHLPENSLPPSIEIDRIIADGKTFSPESGLRLPVGAKDLQIDYTTFSFVDPSRVRFRYRLEGYAGGWNDVNGRRQAFLSNLPPRRYRFRVIASNNDGIWNEAGATLDFVIQPAFYQTNWFRLGCIAMFFALLWLCYRWRLQHVEAKLNLLFEERLSERTRIARELHDTLLQSIAGFALQLEALSKIVTEPSSARDRLREMRRQAEGCLRDARISVSDLRWQRYRGTDLLEEIRHLGEQIVTIKSITFFATATLDRCVTPPQLHDCLLRIVQEALRNAVCHAAANTINVEVTCSDQNVVRIRICDNGCGFDLETASRKPHHMGLANMRERAESIGAALHVRTSPGQGTEIEITARID
jgi:signal transduction histidine kinase/ligand-binding sensor domain-containing protein